MAPRVLLMIAEAPEARGARFSPRLRVATGGSPPSPTLLARMDALGADVTHIYGLTETYGPHVVSELPPGSEPLDVETRARLMARQGFAYPGVTHLRVVDAKMRDVPADGETMGEVVMRGNNVMAGYYEDPGATDLAFAGGLSAEDHVFKCLALGAPYVKAVCMGRALMIPGMVGKNIDRWLEGADGGLPKNVSRYGFGPGEFDVAESPFEVRTNESRPIKLYGVCLVKNEDDVITQTLIHAAGHCEKIFVLDNR